MHPSGASSPKGRRKSRVTGGDKRARESSSSKGKENTVTKGKSAQLGNSEYELYVREYYSFNFFSVI